MWCSTKLMSCRADTYVVKPFRKRVFFSENSGCLLSTARQLPGNYLIVIDLPKGLIN